MPGANSAAGTAARTLAVLLIAAFAVIALRSAWLHDDAFITFRTVDNFVHGFGLRWNVAERVQTYTHPAWMLLMTALYAATHEIYVTVIVCSLVLSVSAVGLVAFGAASTGWAGCVAVLAFGLSKAFVDYSTSGLENPLTHALYAAFLVVYLRRAHTLETLHLLATLSALAALNRMDTALLFAPALVVAWWADNRRQGVAMLLAGSAPLLVWEVFAVVYYGFPFPNTAYAKLFDTGVGTTDRLLHGFQYLQNSLRLDPLTLLTTAAGVVVGIITPDRRLRAVALGVVAYLAYVVYIGGDFVTGRFLSAPLVGGVVLLVSAAWMRRRMVAVAAALVVVVGATASAPPPQNGDVVEAPGNLMDAHGVADERLYYYPYTGALRAWHGVRVDQHPWSVAGLAARRDGTRFTVRGDIGFFGFYAGPTVHVVDVWGLADPLIARLPARTDRAWRVGHFTRDVPAGYQETLMSGTNQIADAATSRLYTSLALATRAPLLAPGRLAAIWRLNMRGTP